MVGRCGWQAVGGERNRRGNVNRAELSSWPRIELAWIGASLPGFVDICIYSLTQTQLKIQIQIRTRTHTGDCFRPVTD